MPNPFRSYPKPFLLWVSLLGVVAWTAASYTWAQTAANERRNSDSFYDRVRGDYYSGRSPYMQPTGAAAESLPVAESESAPPQASRPVSVNGEFGPSHSTVVRDGLKYVIGSMSFPTGLRNHDGLLLEKIVPAEMMAGKPFTYEYRVTNLTPHPIQFVRVMDQASEGLTVQRADPQTTSTSGGILQWDLGRLNGDESRKIRVQGVAGQEGVVTTCGWATYSPVLCEPIRIVTANLQVVMEAPSEISICDPLPYRITVRNSGSSTLSGVQVAADLPEGVTASGNSPAAFEIGSLEPGQTRELTLSTQATRTGRFTARARGTSAQGVSAEDSATTSVVAPALQIACEAPDIRFIGRPAEVCFNVTNSGNAPAANAVVEALLPQGASLRGVTDGARTSGNRVVWNLGTLPAGESRSVCAQMTFGSAGTFQLAAVGRADCVDPVNTACQIGIKGVPGVLLEVIDIDDPIEVGATDTYEIAVTNQGTALDSNITIVCTLEPAQEFVSASGATEGGLTEPGVVRFQPLPKLSPKQTARWRVVVRAVEREDVRFKVTLTTDQISRPVEETEATNQY